MRTVAYTDYLDDDELDSSALLAAWYNRNTQELYVKFHAGNIAGYRDVSLARWDEFVRASSKGRYYTFNIKSNYRGIDGNVTFVKAHVGSTAATTTSGDQYKVTVSFTGDLEFTVNASDFAEAAESVKKTLQSAMAGGDYKVKRVEAL